MYGHQVIEDLRRYKQRKQSYKFDFNTIEKVVKKIQQAKHFHFGSAEEIEKILNIQKGASLFFDKQRKFIDPPNPLCWFDFNIETCSRMTKFGYIFQEISKSWIICLHQNS